MKKLVVFLAVAATLLSFGSAFARAGFSGGGGGVVFVYTSPDLGPINSMISTMGGNMKLDDGFFIYGGKGYGYINRHIRIGGMGAGGSLTTSALVPGTTGPPDIPALAKEVQFDMGYGGVTLEYVTELPFDLQLFAGGMIGWGAISLRLSQYENVLSWNDIWADYGIGYPGDSYDLNNTMDCEFFALSPWVGGFYKILPWMGVSGKAGYFYAKCAEGNWTSVGSNVVGAPEIDLSNVFYEFSIMFGG